MKDVYSTYEAKAKLSEILGKVRAGHVITISYRGENVAEIRPAPQSESIEQRLARLEKSSVVMPADRRWERPCSRQSRPGAVSRFLEERE